MWSCVVLVGPLVRVCGVAFLVWYLVSLCGTVLRFWRTHHVSVTHNMGQEQHPRRRQDWTHGGMVSKTQFARQGVVILVTLLPLTVGFVIPSSTTTICRIPRRILPTRAFYDNRYKDTNNPWVLYATKKKSKKKSGPSKPQQQGFGTTLSKSGGSGGKGTTPTQQPGDNDTQNHNTDDDYAAFPRLDPDVQETLIPCPSSILFDEAGVLPDEVYERLTHIYGLSRFNQELEFHNGASTLLFSLVSEDATSELGLPFALNNDSEQKKDDPAAPSTRNLASVLNQLPPFSEFRVLHMDPLVLAIDDFFTEEECDAYIAMSLEEGSDHVMQSQSPTVGKDSASRSQRTSTTWYHYYSHTPQLMAKATKLVGLPTLHQWEEPQTVRYRKTEKFTWHLDALGPSESRPTKGGQRIATLLVYLSNLSPTDGGATMFRDLTTPRGDRLAVLPKKGSALLFFPAAGGIPNAPFDIRTLHCGQAVQADATHDKWIAQLWLCEKDYTPTAPDTQNLHAKALEAITEYCQQSNSNATPTA